MKIERIIAWAAFIISNAALVFVVLFTISFRYESGYNASVQDSQAREIQALKGGIETYRVYIETLRTYMVSKGLNPPQVPQVEVRPSRPIHPTHPNKTHD